MKTRTEQTLYKIWSALILLWVASVLVICLFIDFKDHKNIFWFYVILPTPINVISAILIERKSKPDEEVR